MIARIALALALTLTVAGCEVDPYCFHCTDHITDGGMVDSHVDAGRDTLRARRHAERFTSWPGSLGIDLRVP